jgi:hypothetical protein
VTLLLLLACDVCETDPVDDALVHIDRSDTPDFWETTDVVANAKAVYTCTGVRSLGVHEDQGGRLNWRDQVDFDGSHGSFPRCKHVALRGDRLVVVSERDELQPTPFVAMLDVSEPLSPVVLREVPDSRLLAGAALSADRVLVTAAQSVVLFDHELNELASAPIAANRAERLPNGWLVGSLEGEVHWLDEELNILRSETVEGPVLDLLVRDEDVVVAAGSVGLVFLSEGDPLRVDTHGTALKLDLLDTGELVVANWEDIRVYSPEGDLLAVEALLDEVVDARFLAAGAHGQRIYAGEWSGVHALEYAPVGGPEVRFEVSTVKVAEDGGAVEVPVQNEGDATLVLGELVAPRGWTASLSDQRLQPGEEALLTLTASADAVDGEVTLCSNDADERPARITVQVGAEALGVGDAFPDFAYRGVNSGEVHTLSEQLGRPVLLAYFATF